MRKDAENLILSADYDLETAEHMLRTGRYVYVIFMCHLAIEKVLKAAVAEVTSRPAAKSHNLLYLAKTAGVTMPGDILEFVSKINNASVVTRYPEDFSKLIAAFPESVAREYLDKAKEAVAWLKRSLKSERS